MTSIAELLDRVRAATGPDWKLDGDLHVTLAGSEPTRDRKAPPYTSSVDAALSLVERKLPGWAVEMERWTVQQSAAVTLLECGPDGWRRSGMRRSEGQAPTLPLAILAALLSALSNEVKP